MSSNSASKTTVPAGKENAVNHQHQRHQNKVTSNSNKKDQQQQKKYPNLMPSSSAPPYENNSNSINIANSNIGTKITRTSPPLHNNDETEGTTSSLSFKSTNPKSDYIPGNSGDEPPTKKQKQSTTSRAWEREYQSLVTFKKRHGHCNVPYRYEDGKSLGTWVARQRKDKDKLSSEQIQKLEALNFTWVSAQERVWMEKFERLRSYWKRFGNSSVPTSYADDLELGEWVAKQRQKFSQGRLTAERQQLLNTVGFVYRINKFIKRKSTAREDKKWFSQLELLIHFLLEHGHTLVPFQYTADKSLGRWVNENRCQNNRGLLRQDRKDILNNIGFVWRVTSRKGELKLEDDSVVDGVWCFRFRELIEYKKEHGSFPTPADTTSKDGNSTNVELAKWAEKQRKLIVAGKMDEMKAQRFATIGFCQIGEEGLWERNYQKILEAGYNIVYSLEDQCLSHWVICQHYLHKKGNLPEERKIKLYDVRGWVWDSSALNLPQPEPKHVVKAKGRRQPSKVKEQKSQINQRSRAQVAAIGSPATTESESDGEEDGGLCLLAIASRHHT